MSRLAEIRRRWWPSLPRRDDVSDRAVALGLSGRFADEITSGLPDILLPTISRALGLSVVQVGWLIQSLNYASAVSEPLNGLLLDLWRRRWLMGFGAAMLGAAFVVMGAAPTFVILLLAYALWGFGSGPLAHTADVVLVESYPEAPDSIFARSTFLDTIGALLAPALVALTFLLDWSWRTLLITMGVASMVYAVVIWRTRFPPPPAAADGSLNKRPWRTMAGNIREVLADRRARQWLFFLVVIDLQDLPRAFVTLWLAEHVGLSQTAVGGYRALEMVVGLLILLWLPRWRASHSVRTMLLAASGAALLLFPLWLYLPGVATRFLLAVPLTAATTLFWPIGRAQSLVSVPGRAGTVTAVRALLNLLPLSVLFGLLASQVSLTTALAIVYIGSTALLLLITLLLPTGPAP